MTVLAVVLSALTGLGGGLLVLRAAARFEPARAEPANESVAVGVAALPERDTAPATSAPSGGPVSVRVPPAVTVVTTTVLCALAGLRVGLGWQLPAFLLLAGVGVLLAVIDLEHRLLPNRIVLPATAGGAALLVLAAAAGDGWHQLRNAVLGAAILFVLFLALALVTPSGLGMGDVKLAGLLGLYLGWLGMGSVAVGAVAGFVVQAVLAVALLLARRVGVKSEIPFGPALMAGAAIAIGGGHRLVDLLAATGKA